MSGGDSWRGELGLEAEGLNSPESIQNQLMGRAMSPSSIRGGKQGLVQMASGLTVVQRWEYLCPISADLMGTYESSPKTQPCAQLEPHRGGGLVTIYVPPPARPSSHDLPIVES